MQVSLSLEVLNSQTGIPKGLEKNGNSGGEEGLTILEFGGHGGLIILEFLKARGWVKMFMLPLIGYGYFLESPNNSTLLIPNIVKGSPFYRHLYPTLILTHSAISSLWPIVYFSFPFLSYCPSFSVSSQQSSVDWQKSSQE